MPHDHQFGLFIQDDKGPLYRGFYTDLEDAKRKAQELADKEGYEFFIYNFKGFIEIARFYPQKRNLAV